MKTLLAVCVMLCVATVYSQDDCRRRVDGPWTWTYIAVLPSYTSGGVTTYGFQCYVPKPDSSGCYGGCSSSDVLDMSPLNWKRNCDCCEAHRVQVVKPWAWCKYVFTVQGCGGANGPTSTWVNHPSLTAHNWYLMDDCKCDSCTSGNGRKRRAAGGAVSGLAEVNVNQGDLGDVTVPLPSAARQRSDATVAGRYKGTIPVRACPVGGETLVKEAAVFRAP